METMAGKYKLAWSAGLSATRFERPRRMDGNGTWSYTLGQAYTNVHTTTYYETSGCKPRLDFWEQVEATMRIPEDTDYWREKMVPLVCGKSTLLFGLLENDRKGRRRELPGAPRCRQRGILH